MARATSTRNKPDALRIRLRNVEGIDQWMVEFLQWEGEPGAWKLRPHAWTVELFGTHEIASPFTGKTQYPDVVKAIRANNPDVRIIADRDFPDFGTVFRCMECGHRFEVDDDDANPLDAECEECGGGDIDVA